MEHAFRGDHRKVDGDPGVGGGGGEERDEEQLTDSPDHAVSPEGRAGGYPVRLQPKNTTGWAVLQQRSSQGGWPSVINWPVCERRQSSRERPQPPDFAARRPAR